MPRWTYLCTVLGTAALSAAVAGLPAASAAPAAATLAFPGAVGFGATAVGGAGAPSIW